MFSECLCDKRSLQTRCALVTGVQTCALPSSAHAGGLYSRQPSSQRFRHGPQSRKCSRRGNERPSFHAEPGRSCWRHGARVGPRAQSRHFDHDDGGDHCRRYLDRSEEHTSELQSLMRISYAVFCLKKKKYIHYYTYHIPKHNSSQTNKQPHQLTKIYSNNI